jgi:putative NIF3 family GTP cyclohydrolase 1 type 2
MPISRRSFLAGAATLAVAQESHALTVGQIIERIQKNVGVPWRAETVDKIIVGNADTPVKGIATTMMATLDVVERASALGRNFIITHEPTFWEHQDTTTALPGDPTVEFKTNFMRERNMAVFRFHDHWHARRPDGIATGMMQELGWEKYASPSPGGGNRFVFPATTPAMTLAALAADIKAKLKPATMRIVGDPKMQVSRVAASWGYNSREPGIRTLAREDVDVLVAGEAREWEVVEYAQDIIASGKKKALILIGHVASEQAGMKYCASWLKGFVTEVPIDFVPAAEPFWAA